MSKLLKNLTFLVVDDEQYFLEILVDNLEHYGAKVETASNGTEAFEMVQMKPFNVVITDIRMPGGDGVTFIKLMDKILKIKPLIYIISAFNDLSNSDCQKLGVSKHFGKPLQLEKLIEALCVDLKIERPSI